MSTALHPPLDKARSVPLARSPFYLAVVVLMSVIVIAGFWPSYFGPLLAGRPSDRPAAIEAHALVYLGWMGLLLLQVVLVYRRRSALHRRIGRAGMVFGLVVLGMGLVASIVSPLNHLRRGDWSMDRAASFLILPLGDMLLWAVLFGAAMWYRRNPEYHKRFILMATVTLLFAPVARMNLPLPLLFVGWLLPVFLGMSYDLWTRRRIHPAYLAGTALMVVVFLRLFVMETAGWRRLGSGLLRAFGA